MSGVLRKVIPLVKYSNLLRKAKAKRLYALDGVREPWETEEDMGDYLRAVEDFHSKYVLEAEASPEELAAYAEAKALRKTVQ